MPVESASRPLGEVDEDRRSVIVVVVVVLVVGESTSSSARKLSSSSVETLTDATRRSSVTKMKPWSRSSSSAIASMRVSWSKLSWIRRRIDWTSSKNSSGSHSDSLDDEDVGVDVVVALVEFVEEHGGSIPAVARVAQYTPGRCAWAGSAASRSSTSARRAATSRPTTRAAGGSGGGVTYAALTTARLGLRTAAVIGVDEAAGRRRRARPAARRRGRPAAGRRSPRARSSTTSRRRRAGVQTCVPSGVPLPIPRLPGVVAARRRPGRSRRSPARSATRGPRPSRTRRLRRGRLAGLAPRRSSPGERVGRRPPRAVGAPAPGRPRRRQPPRRRPGRRRSRRCARLLHPGADLLVTQGRDGGLARRTSAPDGSPRRLRYLPTPTDREVDPTGAGDTFLAALLAVGPPTRRSSGAQRSRASARPPVRGRGRVARGRGPRAGRRPGSRGACSSGGPASAMRRAVDPERRDAGRLAPSEDADDGAVRDRRAAPAASGPAVARLASSDVAAGRRRAEVRLERGLRSPEAAPRSTSRGRAGTASSAAGRSRRRCSWSFAISIQATTAVRPGPAASSARPSTASSWRPRRRSRWARSTAIRSIVHGAPMARGRATAGRAPERVADRRSRPGRAATTTARRRRRGPRRRAGRRDRVARIVVDRRGPAPASRQASASSSRCSRANARASPARSPGGALAIAPRGRRSRARGGRGAGRASGRPGRCGGRRRRGAAGRAAAQELEVAPGDLPALDVADAARARAGPPRRSAGGRRAADGGTAAGRPAAGRGGPAWAGGGAPAQPVARHQERPVEAATVVGDQPGVRPGSPRRAPSRSAGSSRVVGQQELDLAEAGRPPTSRGPTRKATVPGRRAEPGRLRVEADAAGRPAAGWPGRPAEALAVDRRCGRSGARSRTTAPAGVRTHLAVEGVGQPLGELRRQPASRCGRDAASGRPRRSPLGRRSRYRSQPAARAVRPGAGQSASPTAADVRRRDRRRGRPSSRSASALASTSRLEPRTGAGRAAGVAGARARSGPRRPATSSSWRSKSRSDRPTPPGHRLVQVDRRRLVVRRADLGDEAEVARVDHEQDARDRLDRPAGARAARRRGRRAASGRERPRRVSQ